MHHHFKFASKNALRRDLKISFPSLTNGIFGEFYKAETLENHARLFHEVKRKYKQLVENAFCEQRKKKEAAERIIVECSLDLSDGGRVRVFDSAVLFFGSGIHIFPLFPSKRSYGRTI